jgi:butyrate kinase
MVYQTAKAIGAMAAVLGFRPAAVVLTGGIANSARIVADLSARCAALAPIRVYPGSDESLALAEGAARALCGVEQPMQWPVAARNGEPAW